MPKKERTHFLIILDRSGSMNYPQTLRADMQGGINTFLDDQKKVPGKCRVSFVQFDDEYDEVYLDKKLKEVPPVVLIPRGATALLDAMGKSITNLRNHIAGLPAEKKPTKVLVTIITDGAENASVEWDRKKVFDLVKTCMNEGWQFSYLGANQDAIAEAHKYGINANSSMTYGAQFGGVMMHSHSDAVTDWRTESSDQVQYSGAQRKASVGS